MYILRRFCKYLSLFFKFFDKKIIKKYAFEKTEQNVIFILGAPRTGSTIFYQFITSLYSVSYIDNLVNNCKENILVGFSFSKFFYKNTPHNSFNSKYGNTNKLHAPSEAGPVWYRWFKQEAIDLEAIDVDKLNSFKQNINAVLNKYKQPLVVKNLSFDLRIKLLNATFDNVKYIIIRRNPLLVAQSILQARKRVDKNKWWSIKPVNFKELRKQSIYHQIVGQIYFLEKQIFDNLKTYSPNNVLIVNYENLTKLSDPSILNVISNFLNAEKRIEVDFLTKIKINEEIKLTEEECYKFNEIIDSYDWNFKHNFKMI